MNQGYKIIGLPTGSIVEDDLVWQNGQKFLKIKGGTFRDIPFKLSIRPKIKEFLQTEDYSPNVYVVLYADEEKIRCLFAFRFHDKSNKYDIARCIRKAKVAPHWEKVRQKVEKHAEGIREGHIIEFQ